MIGETILHYKILEKLGEGGMGVVYLAEDTKLKRNVAIKFLPKHIAANTEERKRFEVEAQAAASLNHPNIATIHAIEQSDDSHGDKQSFLVMEFVEGKTIKKLIEEDGKSFTIKKVLEIATQVCEGLDAAHEKGIVHRDIKSDNIMLTPKGQVKIMDFGLAKVKGGKGLTAVGSTVGTAAYMSPEQAQGEEVDNRSDIFSFGAVLYEMLTTRLPFDAEHQAALIYSLVNENPQPIARFNDKISPEFERIVFKCLAKDREERYQHVDDILADLRRERKNIEYAHSGYIKTSGDNFKSPAVTIQKKNKFLKIIIPSAVVVLLAAAFFLFNPFKSSNNENPASTSPSNSLAVMYFENIPDPADNDHNSEMLTSLLITSLSQVQGLEVISRERLLNIQKDMGQTDSKTISSSIAEKVAKRAGVTTMLVGSILQEKPMLAVSTRLIDVQTGKIISSQQVTNFKPDKIFNLVDSLSILIQKNLQTTSSGEVKSVSEVTTKSPEAYRAYVAGLELWHKLYQKEAIAAFSRAIELDKNFAMAYFQLSIAQNFTGPTIESQESLKKAVELSDKATERERLNILAFDYVRQSIFPKAIEMYQQLIEKYPHDTQSYLLLGLTYTSQLLDPEKSIEIIRKGLSVEPTAKQLWNLLAYASAMLNRKQDAFDAVNHYLNLAPAEPNPYDTKGDIYAWFREYDSSLSSYHKALSLRSDFGSADKIGSYYLLRQQYDQAKKYFQTANDEWPVIEIHSGRIQDAINKASVLSEPSGTGDQKLMALINYYYEAGQNVSMLRAAQQLSASIRKDPTNLVYGRGYLSWALAKNGKSSEAKNMINSLENDVKGKSLLLQITADYASALVSFEENKFDQALETFGKVMQALPPNHEPNIFYGVTLLKTGQTSEAIGEFQHLLYEPGNNDVYILKGFPGNDFYWPIPQVKAHYWLGVAYEKQGDKNKAISEYKKFLDIWKDADFNSPEISDAKVRLAKLK